MSLYFEERIEEQKEEDPENNKITFLRSWIIEVPSPNEHTGENDDDDDSDNDDHFEENMVTTYNCRAAIWNIDLNLTRDFFKISSSGFLVCKAVCNVSFTLFYDDDMRFEFYSSIKTQMIASADNKSFKAPTGFFQKLVDPDVNRKVAKCVFHIELIIPMKNFCRLFEFPSHHLEKLRVKYPEDLEKNYKFAFLKNGDYTIKCSDGTVPASRVLLNATSKYMREHLDKSEDVEFNVAGHSIDVVKPIIYYLHSRFFQMPKTYDFDFVDRLLKAIDFFNPVEKYNIDVAILLSVCKKFTEEAVDFDGVLRWLKFSYQHKFDDVRSLICPVIANRFYFKWAETFPRNARNHQNPLYLEIFRSDSVLNFDRDPITDNFKCIESIFSSSLFTNVILD